MSLLAVFIGGGAGSVLRYLIALASKRTGMHLFPYHTLIANLIGCFVIGFLFAIFMRRLELNPQLKYLLMAGFCGGLTTFSTFSLEIVNLIEAGHYGLAVLYGGSSVLLCLVAVVLGMLAGNFCGQRI